MGSKLIEIAKSHYENDDNYVRFVDDYKVNDLLNNFDEYPHAFVLGCVMDKQIAAERAWSIPYKIYKELGKFDIDFLADVPVDEYKRLFNEGKYHRFNNQCAEFFLKLCIKLKMIMMVLLQTSGLII